ncbi:MAG: ABC transporter permease [Dehalococcoidia bacterium]
MASETSEAAVQSLALRLAGRDAEGRLRPSLSSRLLHLARRKPLGVAALVLLTAIWTVCLLAPVLAPYGYDQLFVAPRLLGPSSAHIFGTDESGRDVLSRVLFAGRLSLTLSLAATLLGVALAVVFGVVSGYAAGWYDLIFQRVTDSVQALPILVILLILAALFRGDRVIIVTAVALLFAPAGGRLFRAATLALRDQPFVESARVVGASPPRVVLSHVMPNVFPLVIVYGTAVVGANVLLLAALSFLGFINGDYPDWGSMLNLSAATYMVSAPWLVIVPGGAITLSVLGYNLLGDSLRDILDPRLRGS